MDLAAQPSSTPVALKTIAERNDISLQFLEHIFASFRRTGIVKSVKGSQGGYNLAKAADEITVASVVEALEGSYHLEDEDVVAENSYKGISDTIQKLVVDTVNQELDQILSNLTLAQMFDSRPSGKSLGDRHGNELRPKRGGKKSQKRQAVQRQPDLVRQCTDDKN